MIKAIILFTKLIIAAFIAILLTSCNRSVNFGNGINGSGNITTETRTITEDFKSIDVSSGIELILEQSDNKFISVKTDDNLQKLIITKVENGVLIISSEKGYDTNDAPIVKVRMPAINGLESSSGASILSKNTLITNNIVVKSTSGSEINIAVEADFITIESSSGSSIEVSGKALKLETSSSSGSSIDAKKLMVNEVISQASSGSNTEISPILSLKGTASSGSSIDYYKRPNSIIKEENSGGSDSEN